MPEPRHDQHRPPGPDGTIRIRSKDIRWIQRRWDLTGDAHIYFRDLAGAPRTIPSFAHIEFHELDNSHVTDKFLAPEVSRGLTTQEARDRAEHARVEYRTPDLGLAPYSRIVRMFDAEMIRRQRRAKQLREALEKQEEGSGTARRTKEKLLAMERAFSDYVGRIKQELSV